MLPLHKIFYGALLAMGITGNSLFFYSLWRIPLKSKLTHRLLLFQSITDALICSCGCVFLFAQNVPVNSSEVICYIWNSQSIYWALVAMSVSNLIMIACDRFLAVCYAHLYSYSQPVAWYVACALNAVFFSGNFIVNFFVVSYDASQVDNQCFTGDPTSSIFKFVSIVWFLSAFLAPFVCFMVFYSAIYKKFSQSGRMNVIHAARVCPVMVPLPPVVQQSNVWRKFTRMCFMVSIIYIITMPLNAFSYLLASYGLMQYEFDTPLDQANLFLSSVNSSLSPLLYILFLANFRRRFVRSFQCWRQERRMNCDTFT